MKILLLVLMLVIVVAVAFAGEPKKIPAVGDTAPLVEGQDQNGATWKLTDFIGKKVVLLYFYPKDDTSGCTKEACGLRDRMTELQKDNVQVVGVSFDTANSHQRFIAKYNLNFTLIADTDGKIIDTYGVRASALKFARRVSFLIGLDGKIVHVTDAMSAEKHLDEMREAIAKLAKK